jgi:hypothetical protein
LRCNLLRTLVILRRGRAVIIVHRFKLSLKLQLSLAGSLNLSSSGRQFALLLLGFSHSSLLLLLLLFLAELALSDLLLKRLQAGLSSLPLLGKLVFLFPSVVPKNMVSVMP